MIKEKCEIKFIYFDLDNTLWDFKRNSDITLEKLYREKINNTVDFISFKKVYEKHNHRLWRAYEKGEVTAEELKITRFEKTLEELRVSSLAKGEELNDFYLNNLAKLPNLMPHAKEILDYLRPSYSLGILSNGFQQAQYSKMNCSGIIDYFDLILTSDQIGVNKPHPKIFLHAIEKSGYQPKEIAYVGDDYVVDTLGANTMGITGILLDPENKIQDKNILKIVDLIDLKEYF